MSKPRTTMQECDAPTCYNAYEITKEEPYAPGYTFKGGVVIHAGGEGIPPFYACCEEHVTPALKAVLDIQNERDPVTGAWLR